MKMEHAEKWNNLRLKENTVSIAFGFSFFHLSALFCSKLSSSKEPAGSWKDVKFISFARYHQCSHANHCCALYVPKHFLNFTATATFKTLLLCYASNSAHASNVQVTWISIGYTTECQNTIWRTFGAPFNTAFSWLSCTVRKDEINNSNWFACSTEKHQRTRNTLRHK